MQDCYEHMYVLKSLVGQARRNKKKLSLTWLDIRNAFGSVPHAAILATRAIPIQAGVKQGCPLSRILFNLSIELILCCMREAALKLKTGQCEHYGTSISCLAYADDLVIVARSKHALQLLPRGPYWFDP